MPDLLLADFGGTGFGTRASWAKVTQVKNTSYSVEDILRTWATGSPHSTLSTPKIRKQIFGCILTWSRPSELVAYYGRSQQGVFSPGPPILQDPVWQLAAGVLPISGLAHRSRESGIDRDETVFT